MGRMWIAVGLVALLGCEQQTPEGAEADLELRATCDHGDFVVSLINVGDRPVPIRRPLTPRNIQPHSTVRLFLIDESGGQRLIVPWSTLRMSLDKPRGDRLSRNNSHSDPSAVSNRFLDLEPGHVEQTRVPMEIVLGLCLTGRSCGVRARYEYAKREAATLDAESRSEVAAAEKKGLFRGPLYSPVLWLRSPPEDAPAATVCSGKIQDTDPDLR